MKDPEQEAVRFLNAEQGITDGKAALDGARHILMERFAEQADLLKLRTTCGTTPPCAPAWWPARSRKGPSSRTTSNTTNRCTRPPPTGCWPCCAAATRILNLALVTGEDEGTSPCEGIIAHHLRLNLQTARQVAAGVVSWTWKIKLSCRWKPS
jgi:uncharacterized protein